MTANLAFRGNHRGVNQCCINGLFFPYFLMPPRDPNRSSFRP